MTTGSTFTVSLVRLSLCVAPLCLSACLDQEAELAGLDDELSDSQDPAREGDEPTGLDVAANPGSPYAAQIATSVAIDDPLNPIYPDARCNDGSIPEVKVKLDPNGGTNWLVYLQGGGGCNSVSECEWRWRDCDGTPAHSIIGQHIGGKRNMMADLTGMNFDGWGIMDFDGHDFGGGVEPSPFAGKGYNRIFIPYCSSDSWRGLGNSHVVNFPATCSDMTSTTLLHFGGGKIVEAVIDQIMASQQAPGDGDFIVLAGGSAGGSGVQHNLDHVADQAQAIEPGVNVVGVADASYGMGLDQDGIPTGISLVSELFWAADSIHTPGDPIDVVVDDSCWSTEPGSDKDYCHSSPYVLENYQDNALMLTSNNFDDAVHGDLWTNMSSFWPTECGVTITNTGGLDPDMDALYLAYCAPPGVDPASDIQDWMRFQTGNEGAAILDTTTNLAYYITHSDEGLHDKLLKKSDHFYKRATASSPNGLTGTNGEFAGLGGWTGAGNNLDPSVASTVACALELVELGSLASCELADARVTSTLPTQVTVIENYVN
jgi:hypothetical protein